MKFSAILTGDAVYDPKTACACFAEFLDDFELVRVEYRVEYPDNEPDHVGILRGDKLLGRYSDIASLCEHSDAKIVKTVLFFEKE